MRGLAKALAALAALDAETLDPDDPASCPSCHTRTTPTRTGDRTLCLRCTEAELGASHVDNSLRIEYGMSWRTYWAKVETYGAPWQNLKAWTHSAERQRKWRRNGVQARGVVHQDGPTTDGTSL